MEMKLEGKASWYSSRETCPRNPHKSCPTASGRALKDLERSGEDFFASWECYFGKRYKIKAFDSGRYVVAVCVDRGPAKRLSRICDLGKRTFERLDDPAKGLIDVSVEPYSATGN